MLEGLKPLPRKQRGCGYTKALQEMDPSDQQILEGAMADESWSTYGLAKAIRERGVDINYQVLYRHRTKGCACA